MKTIFLLASARAALDMPESLAFRTTLTNRDAW
jgi:hypothetical protein